MYGDKRSLLSIRPKRARRPFDASVDQTEERCAKLKGVVRVPPPACRAGPKCRPPKPGRAAGDDGARVAMDTDGEFVSGPRRPRIRLPGTPYLPQLPTKRPTAGIRRQYQQWLSARLTHSSGRG